MAIIKVGLRLLETLTSALYDDPIILFREYVQNSVDAYNKTISTSSDKEFDEFHVAIDIDRDGKSITIRDNGYGIDNSQFDEIMTSIGASDKRQSNNQIGFRGIGRLSAMPFCEKLIFTNKCENSNKIQVFQWQGNKFQQLLNQESEIELNQAMSEITDNYEKDYEDAISDHFFKVEIINYNIEIVELVKQDDLKYRLSMMLPLRYDPKFEQQKDILEYYKQFMGYSLDRYAFTVKLDGEEMYKPYNETNILESGINFWDLRYRSKEKNGIPDKIGILWFTFNRKVTANPVNEPYGILVRSKNMLMGDNNSLADALFRSKSDEYVATFRELTQTLQGVYGEMLIDSPRLNDNARRDWFKIDDSSIELRNIIFDFMKRLYTYRSVASRAFNAIENDKNRQKLTEAFTNLTSNYEPKVFVETFYEDKRKTDKKALPTFKYADDDIPLASLTNKKFYEKIAESLREYFMQTDNIQEFLKVRAHIKRSINKG